MTDTSAPAEVVQPWTVNPDTPSVIMTPHGRISISWATQRAGEANDYALAEETAAMIVAAVNALNAQPLAADALDAGAIEAAARALVDKLDLIGPDPGGAFTMLTIRGMGYQGPTYGEELAALKAALSPGKTVGAGEGAKG